MAATTVLERASLRVVDYRCAEPPGAQGVVERHGEHSLAYVRSGSFGYHSRGRRHELVELMADGPYLAGERVTLADLHAAPIMIYAQMSPEGAALMRARPTLETWLTRVGRRSCIENTRTPLELLAWHSAAAPSGPRPVA